ncbi:hypothetical protein FGO68_gene6380 [Halteria grandinella]|uniref:Homeobox domain-containing protein n=1 Tax=Halteria grandinella TaxID=5974 RepID=A0A8J8NKF0_HALGN|nr:hypothetical protein FGO68_gene6380 [Halteria grandinella]
MARHKSKRDHKETISEDCDQNILGEFSKKIKKPNNDDCLLLGSNSILSHSAPYQGNNFDQGSMAIGLGHPMFAGIGGYSPFLPCYSPGYFYGQPMDFYPRFALRNSCTLQTKVTQVSIFFEEEKQLQPERQTEQIQLFKPRQQELQQAAALITDQDSTTTRESCHYPSDTSSSNESPRSGSSRVLRKPPPRHYKTEHQLIRLQQEFTLSKGEWSYEKRMELADELGLTKGQIDRWIWEERKEYQDRPRRPRGRPKRGGR